MRLSALLLAGAALAAEPGFDDVFDPSKFPEGGERRDARRQAFEAAAKARGVGAAVAGFRRAEAAIRQVRERVDADYALYRKLSGEWWAWRRQHEADHWKKHGKPPADYPVPPGLNRAFLDQELAFDISRSLLLQEREFHDWAFARTAALLRESYITTRSGSEGGGRQAIAKGLSDRSPEQRLRCARLAEAPAAATASRSESHPGVLAALAEAAPSERLLAHQAWPVRAGAVRGARKLGTREAAAWLVARLDHEKGRLVDDLVDALRGMSGEDIGYDPAAWRAWLEKLPADWRAKGGGAGEGPKGLLDEPAVPGTFSDGPVSFAGVASRTLAAVYCVQASAGWEQVREEVKRSVATLPEGAVFGVVAYDSEPRCFRPSLAEANGANRDALAQWLDKLEPDQGADPYAGLMAALALAAGKSKAPEADTIFLVALTKAPEGTLYEDPRQVGQEVRAANEFAGIRIHCVGRSSGAESFYLHHLANQWAGFHVNG
jgi:hypothetical protein